MSPILQQQFRTSGMISVPAPTLGAVEDYTINQQSVTTGWTPGATLVDQVQSQGNVGNGPFLLNSYSITAYMQCGGGNAGYGKLGKVYAGLTNLPPTLTANIYGIPENYNIPIAPLPLNQSLFAVLFDPATDLLPPNYKSGASLPVTASNVLPQPVQVSSLTDLNMGIWMAPSLVQASGSPTINQAVIWLRVLSAGFTVSWSRVT